MMSREWRSLDGAIVETVRELQRDAPVRLSAIAERLGLRVVSTVLPSGISGEIRPDKDNSGRYIIRVNRNDSARRQRFTVAHEIAHFLLHRDAIGDGITDDVLYRSGLSDQREAQANRLAADLLMPSDLIDRWIDRADALRVDDVPTFLADKFNVSHAAMKIRLGVP